MHTTDTSGYAIFSLGDAGHAHVLAHQALDGGRPHDGHAALGRWLETHRGEGPAWVHLQWHMVVFELALGLRAEARARFEAHVLPAVEQGHAPVDAPAGLWRLWLATSGDPTLPWQPVRAAAAVGLRDADDAYQALHHLLALAGAGDLATIDAWIEAHRGVFSMPRCLLLLEAARALRAVAAGQWQTAATILARCAPRIGELGGSRAQNELFDQLWRLASERAGYAREVAA